MNILILSRRERYYATMRLVETCRESGHSVTVIDPLKYVITNSKEQIQNSRPRFDLILPRIGNVAIEYSLALVKYFELSGIPAVNGSAAIYLAKDKFVSLMVLKAKGLPVLKTVMLRSRKSLGKTVKQLGGLPIVIKPLRGSQGIGVALAKTMKELYALLKANWDADHDAILQEYIPESKGQDIRILVIGNKVIGGMKRYAPRNDFRSNIHQGGRGELIKLPALYKTLAKKAVKALGLQIGGVDILESKRGPLIIEVNASPGFEGLEKVTGKDIAKEIIDFSTGVSKRDKKR
ncbi:MAG: RimK family alpha-L-glutamate ligase [Planctomycetes bacterium]|nr:RimK family alpha-L-glutamate ligase [Planctomycetota bacterium]